MTHRPQTIDEVLKELDKIIETSIDQEDYLAIFAYVYRRTTAQIRTEILSESFENNERMEKMDVIFANRYLDAYHHFINGKHVSSSWLVPFQVRNQSLTIMQHLLAGMSAHINFDLGIAASEVSKGQDIKDVKNDFMKVNEILADLTNEMQERIGRVSKLMFLLDWVGGKSDERIANYSIKKARHFSWHVATTLVLLDGENKEIAMKKFDNEVAKLNHVILSPRSKILNFALKIISSFEEKNTKIIVSNLSAD